MLTPKHHKYSPTVHVKVPHDFEETRVAWVKAVKELGKANTKWAKLQVPGSLVRLVRTQLELSIMSIPDPKVNTHTILLELVLLRTTT